MTGELGRTLSKKEALEDKIEQIDQIQSEMEKYEDVGDDREFTEGDNEGDGGALESLMMLLKLLEHFGVSGGWIKVERRRLKRKYEGNNYSLNRASVLDELVEDLMYLMREGMDKIEEEGRQVQDSREMRETRQESVNRVKSEQIVSQIN